jgi:hypothetical protein
MVSARPSWSPARKLTCQATGSAVASIIRAASHHGAVTGDDSECSHNKK